MQRCPIMMTTTNQVEAEETIPHTADVTQKTLVRLVPWMQSAGLNKLFVWDIN